MCFNAIIIPKERLKVSQALDLFIKLIDKARFNDDGFFIYSHPSQTYLRTLSSRKYMKKLLKALLKSEAIHTHMRLATTGSIVEDNVHGWRIGNYYISHNGTVSAYSHSYYYHYEFYKYIYTPNTYIKEVASKEEIRLSDTHRLIREDKFREHLLSRKFDKLLEFMLDKGFHGVMLINNQDFSEIYVLSVNKPAVVFENSKILIISNERVIKAKKLLSDGAFNINKDGEVEELAIIETRKYKVFEDCGCDLKKKKDEDEEKYWKFFELYEL